jgi:hypothetical protein
MSTVSSSAHRRHSCCCHGNAFTQPLPRNGSLLAPYYNRIEINIHQKYQWASTIQHGVIFQKIVLISIIAVSGV